MLVLSARQGVRVSRGDSTRLCPLAARLVRSRLPLAVALSNATTNLRSSGLSILAVVNAPTHALDATIIVNVLVPGPPGGVRWRRRWGMGCAPLGLRCAACGAMLAARAPRPASYSLQLEVESYSRACTTVYTLQPTPYRPPTASPQHHYFVLARGIRDIGSKETSLSLTDNTQRATLSAAAPVRRGTELRCDDAAPRPTTRAGRSTTAAPAP